MRALITHPRVNDGTSYRIVLCHNSVVIVGFPKLLIYCGGLNNICFNFSVMLSRGKFLLISRFFRAITS